MIRWKFDTTSPGLRISRDCYLFLTGFRKTDVWGCRKDYSETVLQGSGSFIWKT